MKKVSTILSLMTILSSTHAFAGSLVCKGGILGNGMDRFSTLTQSEETNVLTGYKANSVVGGFTFKAVKNAEGRMNLTISSDSKKGAVIGESGNSDSLTIPVGEGFKASVFCGEE